METRKSATVISFILIIGALGSGALDVAIWGFAVVNVFMLMFTMLIALAYVWSLRQCRANIEGFGVDFLASLDGRRLGLLHKVAMRAMGFLFFVMMFNFVAIDKKNPTLSSPELLRLSMCFWIFLSGLIFLVVECLIPWSAAVYDGFLYMKSGSIRKRISISNSVDDVVYADGSFLLPGQRYNWLTQSWDDYPILIRTAGWVNR
ncbi:hypothetical protein GC425_08065 [Corynebacterium sp. zg254]|uniref:RDD family protein n=1 Tax=Corynebacterium zhongnanshanii TaxID=2768834 RepID=A0ABQ6VD26_9CORY|nr:MULTISPECIES: hypothetical protein [Corynebacterium]KAB3519864.1 hypothetical protein F8377_08105 [Corynebacterium zhongnanshanii]MCR5914803.1 hypothetical protein [Corynebacterium sp. zg254]